MKIDAEDTEKVSKKISVGDRRVTDVNYREWLVGEIAVALLTHGWGAETSMLPQHAVMLADLVIDALNE